MLRPAIIEQEADLLDGAAHAVAIPCQLTDDAAIHRNQVIEPCGIGMLRQAHRQLFQIEAGARDFGLFGGGAGLTPEKIETHAAVTLAKTDGGFAVTKIALTTTASVPGASKEAFDKAAADAKAGCPISKLFANNTDITLDAKLV